MAPDSSAAGWSVVVPVKVLARAKSRLAGLDDGRRARLALAMTMDTVSAVTGSPAVGRVIVVTDDGQAREQLAGLGAIVIGDEPAAGLNPALAFGAAYARSRWPGAGRAGLAGDLPALQSAEISRALGAAALLPQAFVPDAEGAGTTLYAASGGAQFSPSFGPESRAAHRALGAVQLDLPDIAGLRTDVDTLADLRLAAAIGLGPHTRILAAALLAGQP
jgi:2-phospho-L-lactate/phosphoenolpyruvate guanylyltransferase